MIETFASETLPAFIQFAEREQGPTPGGGGRHPELAAATLAITRTDGTCRSAFARFLRSQVQPRGACKLK